MPLVLLAALLVAALALVPLVDDALSAIALAGVAMAGAGGLYVLATAEMLANVPTLLVSRAGGCAVAVQSIAYIFFAPAIGAVLDRTQSYTPAMMVVGLLALPASLLWALWPTRTARQPGGPRPAPAS